MQTHRTIWKTARRLARRAGLRTLFDGAYSVSLLAVASLWSIFFPRHPQIWLFGHNRALFAGNSKYLFLWVSIHRPDLRAIWIAGDRETCRIIRRQGFTAHHRWSPGGILATLRAGVFFYCHGLGDVVGPLTRGAYLVNLWHGIGLKATEFGDKNSVVYQCKQRWPGVWGRLIFHDYLTPPDIVVTTSDFMQRHFAEQFRLPLDRCPQLGYPRLDCTPESKMKTFCVKIDEEKGFHFNEECCEDVYIYMPTWRETQRPFIAEALPDLPRLNKILSDRNSLLYVKLHPWTREGVDINLSNIRIWPDEVEIYTYLDGIDILITDYSSILYDYIMRNDRGVILYTFDLSAFISSDRTILYPFEENTAGVRVDTFADLCAAIENGQALEPCPEIAAIRTKFWQDHAVPMSPAVVRYVEDAIEARLA